MKILYHDHHLYRGPANRQVFEAALTSYFKVPTPEVVLTTNRPTLEEQLYKENVALAILCCTQQIEMYRAMPITDIIDGVETATGLEIKFGQLWVGKGKRPQELPEYSAYVALWGQNGFLDRNEAIYILRLGGRESERQYPKGHPGIQELTTIFQAREEEFWRSLATRPKQPNLHS